MNTKNILLILLCAGLISSCDLKEEPYGFYSEDNFLKSAEDFEAGVGYAYDALTFLEYSRTIFYLGDLPSETVGIKPDEGAGSQELDSWQIQNYPTNPKLVNFFKYAYIAINRANIIIDQAPGAQIDMDIKNRYLGEAYFLRAWNYFNLVRYFGLVPIHTTNVSTLDQTAAPLATNLDEVYNLILSDVRKAEELLGIDQRTGRADKVAAQSLAAKAYLFIASAKENNVPLYSEMDRDVKQMYDSVAHFSGKVLYDQSVYRFDDNLLDIFDVEKPKGPEHIFLMSMDRTGMIEGDYSKISKLFIPYIAGGDIYLDDKNGNFTKSHDGFGTFQTKETFYASFPENDLRAELMIIDSVYNQSGDLIANYPNDFQYRFSRKYVDPLFIGDKTSTKPYLIRFSDVALVYAEAVGPTPEAYELVNYIRERAGVEPLNPNLGLEEFREAILQERAWELAFEGHRLPDLRRFNKVTTLVEEASGLSPEQVAFYPLPQIEIDLNQGL
ncbi:MAG: RagB/SusD family nutrient uptake outer membrane protein [Zunongwangia sp.]|uniref:RagB/SusD family nutrient uptake outer membrane protein n=2 Tax=Zunongwangia profunda TaxID=398743 RepID=D5BDX0_ZUNPS|nr:RagB/SusD family nutrient uptake outer membrane protein [Zunongwangia profunda]MAG85929.1 RagB/SusD family nutrient uptake outer membrane protein [Flavobacteriaceae bacterium]MAO37746.1 RagB/SusD family nutrient uptake outer membrane protein [Zunongwangia sp.]ADF50711.1 hypothetical protein ZPR_0352 [Zunongwangia profunda SM-A87]MAS69707.1 RagB/SusD family nutrient uptake outer membrane protein [Zunongwangia sp.]HCV81211.1 RagB/SusD family nutrient uptake outer membrane protein [Zunongwangi|tara:strand:- start:6354 stop:7847 length:1494 start_codon:yes stop_codon:yes gene_type:complete